MTKKEAEDLAEKINKHIDLRAQVVRILPAAVDPAQTNDTGWDVEITVMETAPDG